MVDWTKPIELTDGTPVEPFCRVAGIWPDSAGQYHVGDGDGGLVGFFNEDGSQWGRYGVRRVRNRAEHTPEPEENLTELRDRFAMAALGAIYAGNDHFSVMAKDAYRLADAMLEARKR